MLDHNTSTRRNEVIVVNDEKVPKGGFQWEATVGAYRHATFDIRNDLRVSLQYLNHIKYSADHIRNQPTLNTIRFGNLRHEYSSCLGIDFLRCRFTAATGDCTFNKRHQ